MSLRAKVASMLLASVSAATLAAQPAFTEPRVAHGARLATKKGGAADLPDGPVLLATLEQVHTGEHLALDDLTPTQERFDALLADRSTGDAHPLDAQLLGLLRALAAEHPGSRIELVSGYRSPKLNEMLRKKGHHVASHSQHSLGHACDFRVVPPGQELALDPRVIEGEIRALGWQGGVGVYPTHDDWFVHADVGRNRHWEN
ncbi:MAG TPA: DUF882 domain-containing protein [Polyangiaceae bacterium]|jgi:uncharacterized protein YcbK (DUF882 family)|nr:DUF882 domain-containing protein [Polyangiaceae bacterium]